MTTVELKQEGKKRAIYVFGHCNAGRINGTDLCCCAVSMLVFTMLKALSHLQLKNYRSSYAGGWCFAEYNNKSKDSKKADLIIHTILNGFSLLQDKYPQNVKIINRMKGVEAL